MRTMGLDVGSKTVGVALSDALGLTAQPHSTLHRKNLQADSKALAALAKAHEVQQWVVGLPLHMNATEGASAQAARKLGECLRAHTGFPVHYWDERLTSVMAERMLTQASLSREKRKQVVNHVAAALILQSWLDAQESQAL
ncbi:MAG: Holliday junction resolvase RuvX [Cystobacterineae bacterium]|nr:Holliday junction resolvase RuvX [Cystobacterineae bacterium]